jgi:hypothetical protein
MSDVCISRITAEGEFLCVNAFLQNKIAAKKNCNKNKQNESHYIMAA